jgi:hypothetical protein
MAAISSLGSTGAEIFESSPSRSRRERKSEKVSVVVMGILIRVREGDLAFQFERKLRAYKFFCENWIGGEILLEEEDDRMRAYCRITLLARIWEGIVASGAVCWPVNGRKFLLNAEERAASSGGRG